MTQDVQDSDSLQTFIYRRDQGQLSPEEAEEIFRIWEEEEALKSEVATLFRTLADPEEVAKETGRIKKSMDDLGEVTEEVDPITIRVMFRGKVENFL